MTHSHDKRVNRRVMGVRAKIEIGIAAALVAILCLVFFQHHKIQQLIGERNRYKCNTETLLSDVELYRTRDSLSAARVQSLELTVREYERFRADDAELIRALKAKNRDLSSINKSQSETIIELRARPRDTVILRDSIKIPAVAVHCGDEWYDFDGLLTDEEFSGTLHNRDSLVLVESVRYRRFLGFLWKTRKVRDRQLDAVSKNPHTEIKDLEYVYIER